MAITHQTVYPGIGWPTHLIALMAPSVAAFIASFVQGGMKEVKNLWSRVIKLFSNWLILILIFITLFFAFIPVLLDKQITLADLGKYSGAPDKGLLAILLVLLLNGYGEEIGWRGFVADRYIEIDPLWKVSGKVFLVWAPWHLPLFFVLDSYKNMNLFMLIGLLVSIYFGSVVLTWLYKYSDKSLVAVVSWHIAYNLSVATAASKGFATGVVSTAVIVGGLIALRKDAEKPVVHS